MGALWIYRVEDHLSGKEGYRSALVREARDLSKFPAKATEVQVWTRSGGKVYGVSKGKLEARAEATAEEKPKPTTKKTAKKKAE